MSRILKVIYVLVVVTSIILSSAVTYFLVYDPCEKVILVEKDMEEETHTYDVTWTKNTVVMSQEEIDENLNRALFYSDGKKLNGLIDGTYQFYLDFEIPEKFLEKVTITVSWKDRFPTLNLRGRDVLYVDIYTPFGGKESALLEFPVLDLINRLKSGESFFTTSNTTIEINECPPDETIIANSTEDALGKYWGSYDILSYNKGYGGKWEIKGISDMREIRLVRRARNIFRNLIVNSLIDDALNIEISYSYYSMEITDLV